MSEKGPRIILDLCGGTGAWSRPYKEAGYDVRVITLPEYDVTTAQCKQTSDYTHDPPKDGATLFFFKQTGGFRALDVKDVCGILAAPPCTEFSIAKNGSHRKRDLTAGMRTVTACMNIIWFCQEHGKLQFWAMENPVGYLRQFLGIPHYTFYQWWFGDNGIKRTDLWGYFNSPKQKVFGRPDNPYFVKQYKSGKKNQFCWSTPKPPEWYEGPPLDRAALRAITPAGFAEAFYRANKPKAV